MEYSDLSLRAAKVHVTAVGYFLALCCVLKFQHANLHGITENHCLHKTLSCACPLQVVQISIPNQQDSVYQQFPWKLLKQINKTVFVSLF